MHYISVQCFPQDIFLSFFFFCWGGKASETAFRPHDINPPSKLIFFQAKRPLSGQRNAVSVCDPSLQINAAARPSCYWWLLWLACRESWIKLIKKQNKKKNQSSLEDNNVKQQFDPLSCRSCTLVPLQHRLETKVFGMAIKHLNPINTSTQLFLTTFLHL